MKASTGFPAFKAHIDQVTKALGEPSLRPAVADHAVECLRMEAQSARNLRWVSDLGWSSWWTTCSDAELDAGRARSESTLHLDTSSLGLKATAEGQWRGATIRLRGLRIQFEGGGFRLPAGSCFPGGTTYDRRQRCDVAKWQVNMDKEIMRIAGHGYGKLSTSHSNSEAGGMKALRRMVKDFLGVELVNL